MSKFVMSWLIFVVVLDAFLFMGQVAIDDINPAGHTEFFDKAASITAENDLGNYSLDQDVLGKLPQGEGSVSPETGNIFTDIFTSIKSWIAETTGLNYLLSYVNAFPNFLAAILPGAPVFVFIIGSMWHTINVFAIVLLIWGRDS